MDLLIIEAPRKLSLFKGLVERAGLSCNVTATCGRFLDLPMNELGIDQDLLVHSLEPVNLATYRHIKSEIEEAETVYVATDPDPEGDFIAWQLCLLSSDKDFYRIRMTELTDEAFEREIGLFSPVDETPPPAYFRRIMDRLIGYSYAENKQGLKGRSVGRVTTAMLSHLACNDNVVGELNASVAINGEFPAELSVAIPQSAIREIEAIQGGADLLITEDDLEFVGVFEEADGHREGVTLNDLLTECSIALSADPESVYNEAQALYEQGCLSYIRTDSGSIGAGAAAACRSICSAYGLESSINSNGLATSSGHGAIVPLASYRASIESAPSDFLRDRVFSWIANAAIITGMNKSSCEIYRYRLRSTSKLARLVSKCSSDGVVMLESRRQYREGCDAPFIVSPSRAMSFNALRPELTPPEGVRIIRYSKKQILANELVSTGLGHPGSLIKHITKLESLITDKAYLTPRGRSMLEYGVSKIPALANVVNVIEAEKYLLSSPASSVNLDKALDVIGLDRGVIASKLGNLRDVGRPRERKPSNSIRLRP